MIAIPGTFQIILKWWYFELMTLFSGAFHNTAQLSASVVLGNISSVMHLFPMGVGITVTILVGNAIGAGDILTAKIKAKYAFLYCFIV